MMSRRRSAASGALSAPGRRPASRPVALVACASASSAWLDMVIFNYPRWSNVVALLCSRWSSPAVGVGMAVF